MQFAQYCSVAGLHELSMMNEPRSKDDSVIRHNNKHNIFKNENQVKMNQIILQAKCKVNIKREEVRVKWQWQWQ